MGLVSNQFANTNNNFAPVTFEVTDGWQTVEPIAVTVGIIGARDTAAYSGTAHTVSGYTATASNSLYNVNSDYSFSGTAEASRTDVGTTNMGLSSSQFANTNNNFAPVTFEVTDGWQTVDPIAVIVTIVGVNNTIDYDGTTHTVSGYTATVNSTLYDVDDDITFSGTATASRTDVGTTNMGLSSNQFTNTNNNFAPVTFEVTDGWQTVEPIAVTVSIVGARDTAAYNGTAHTVSGYIATANSTLYDVDDNITFSGTATASRTDVGTTNMGLTLNQFANTNNNFAPVTFVVTDGWQTINPIAVTVSIVGHHNTTIYDGLEHSVSGYDASYGSSLYTAGDYTFTGTASASRIEQGTTNMNLTSNQFANTNNNFSPVTFEVTDGYQTITALDAVVVTIVGHRDTAIYNGNAHSVSGYEVSISNPLYTTADFNFNGTATVSRMDAGTSPMGLAANQFTNTNGNFANVSFEVTDGWQTVNQLPIDFVGESKTLTYNGNLQAIEGVTPMTLVTGHSYSGLYYRAEGTNVGTYPGSFSGTLVIKDAQNREVTSNYAVTTTSGALTISHASIPVTFTGESGSKTYNGAAQSIGGITASGLLPGHTYSDLSYTATGTNVGNHTGVFTGAVKIWSGGVDVTENYVVTEVPGTLDITARDITVSVADKTLEYDGNEQQGNTACSFSNLVGGHTATISYAASRGTLVSAEPYNNGEYTLNSLQVKDANNQNVTSNYNLTSAVTGKLTIINRSHPFEITVVANSSTGNVYDGTERSVTGFQTLSFEVNGNSYTVEGLSTSNPHSTNVCSLVNQITGTAVVRDVNNNDVTNQFTVNKTNGVLEIIPKQATITLNDAQKVYGSDDPVFTGTVSGLVNGNDLGTVSYIRTGDDENAGTYHNVLTATYTTNANYTVTINPANFTISRAVATVTADDKTKIYGDDDPNYTATVNGLQRGDAPTVLTYSFSRGGGENVGDYDIIVGGQAGQGNYNVTFVGGTLTIERASLTVMADEKEKIYGDEDPTLTATLVGLKFNDQASVVSYNLSREEGEDIDDYIITVTGNAVQGNYNVHYVSGFMTIVAAPVIVTAEAKTKVYGDEDPTLTATVSGLKNGDDESLIVYSLSRAAGENVGSYAITPSGNNIQGNYVVTYNNSMLNITRAQVTLSLVDASKVYGDPDPNMVVAAGLKNGDDLSVLTYTLTREPGENIGTKTVTLSVTIREQNNYVLNRTTLYGWLTITRANVTVKADDKVKVYGTQDPALTVTISGMKNGDDESIISYRGLSRPAGENVGVYPISVTGTNNQGNYYVTFQSGTFTIVSHSVNVTITGNTGTKSYNGYEQSVTGYNVTLPEGTELTEADIVCSRPAEAVGTNAGTYNMGLTADDFTNTNASYSVNFIVTDGSMTINRVLARVQVNNVTKAFGEADPAFTATVTGLKGNDDASVLSYTFSRESGEAVGEYFITASGNAVQGNYNVAYQRGKLTIIAEWPDCPELGETSHIPATITDRTEAFQAVTPLYNVAQGVTVSDAYYTITIPGMADVVVPASNNNGSITADISIPLEWRGKAITVILTAIFDGCGNSTPFVGEPKKICVPYDIAPSIVYTSNTSGENKTDLFRNEGTVILMAGLENRDDHKIAEYGFLISTNPSDVDSYNSAVAKVLTGVNRDTMTYRIGLDSCTKHLYYKPYLKLNDCDSTIVYGQRKHFTMWHPDLHALTVAPSTTVAQGTEITLSAVATMTVGSWPQLYGRFVDQLNHGASYHGYAGCYLGTDGSITKNMEEWMHILLDCPLAGNIVSGEMHLNPYDADFEYEWQPINWHSAEPHDSGVTTTVINQTTTYQGSAVFSYRGMECKVSRTITVTVQ